MQIQHTILYFSGVVDEQGNGAKELSGDHGQDVLSDFEQFHPPPGSTLKVQGFGGTLKKKKEAVTVASTWLGHNHDPFGKLIIYGYSAGGINSLDLCRFLQVADQMVHLLVLVDASGRGERVDRHVPRNVARTKNYFQTDTSALSSDAVGGRAIGHNVININCDDLHFNNVALTGKSRHGQMQDLLAERTSQDVLEELRRQAPVDHALPLRQVRDRP